MAPEKRITSGFAVEPTLLEEADKAAEEADRSRSAIIRIALKEYLERKKDTRGPGNGNESRE